MVLSYLTVTERCYAKEAFKPATRADTINDNWPCSYLFYNQSKIRERSGKDDDSHLQPYVDRPWEVEKGGGDPPSPGGGIALSENDSFPSHFVKTKLNPNAEKVVYFDRLWYFSCFSLEVREWSDACVDRCVFIPEQICLRTPTNMFHISWQIYAAYLHKYIRLAHKSVYLVLQICCFRPTNMFTKFIKFPVQLTGFWLSNSI